MTIVGIILLVVGAGLFWGHRTKKAAVYKMRSTEERTAADISQIAHDVASELGPGNFEETAQIVGDIECDAPLTSPLGERGCAYYSMSVKREYEEEYWAKDSHNNQVRRTRRGTDSVANNAEGCMFRINDGTGTLSVVPDGAKFDGLVQTIARFDPASGMGMLSYGRWSFQVSPMTTGRRTLGYRYEEHILPLDRRLTILGPVTDKMGQLALRTSGKDKLLISTRSRDELIASARKAAKLFLIFSITSGLAGVTLTVVGLVSR